MTTNHDLSQEGSVEPTKPVRVRFFGTKRRMFIVFMVFLILVSATIGYFVIQKLQQPRLVNQETQAIYDRIAELKKQGVPKDEIGKVGYYVSLGGAYADVGEDDKALVEFLNADKAISDRSAGTGMSVNIAVAKLYKKDGNKSQAKTYFQRELDRVSQDPEHLSEPEGKKIIEDLKSQIRELE
ncbi:MAG: hypothetical protein ABIR46_01315 [Candidatus Saccharimonadales bacterium]